MRKLIAWLKSDSAQFPLIGLLVIAAAATISWWQPDWGMRVMNIAFAGIVFGKMAVANLQIEGHGVGTLRRHWHLLGIPWPITLLYGFLMAMIILIGILGNGSGLMPQTILNFQLLSACMLCGWFGGVAHWYYYAHDATFYYDEYAERMRLKALGYPPEAVEKAIALVRSRGLFGPKKP